MTKGYKKKKMEGGKIRNGKFNIKKWAYKKERIAT